MKNLKKKIKFSCALFSKSLDGLDRVKKCTKIFKIWFSALLLTYCFYITLITSTFEYTMSVCFDKILVQSSKDWNWFYRKNGKICWIIVLDMTCFVYLSSCHIRNEINHIFLSWSMYTYQKWTILFYKVFDCYVHFSKMNNTLLQGFWLLGILEWSEE